MKSLYVIIAIILLIVIIVVIVLTTRKKQTINIPTDYQVITSYPIIRQNDQNVKYNLQWNINGLTPLEISNNHIDPNSDYNLPQDNNPRETITPIKIKSYHDANKKLLIHGNTIMYPNHPTNGDAITFSSDRTEWFFSFGGPADDVCYWTITNGLESYTVGFNIIAKTLTANTTSAIFSFAKNYPFSSLYDSNNIVGKKELIF